MIGPTQRPLPTNTQMSQDKISMNPAEFEPAIPANERWQTHDLDRVVPGVSDLNLITSVT